MPPLTGAGLSPGDLAPLLDELDQLAARTARLRARLAQAAPMTPGRPGWPIRRLPRMHDTAPDTGGGA